MSHLEQALVFVVDDLHYAIDSDEVIQILRVPDITPVPLVHSAIRGICPIEGSILPVMDGHYLLSQGKGLVKQTKESARIIRIRFDKYVFALLVDKVMNNVMVDDTEMEHTEADSEDPVTAIIRYQDNIVQLLSIDRLLRDIAMPEVTKQDVTDGGRGAEKIIHSDEDDTKYLFFMMGAERFALDAEKVREIIFYPEDVTDIANSASEVLGLFTIRAHVIVAIDLRAIFGMETPITERSRIIIVQHEKRQIGLLVDSILDIKDVHVSKLEALPDSYKRETFEGVVKLNEQLVSVIDTRVVNRLIDETKHFVDGRGRHDYDDMVKEVESTCESDVCEVVVFNIGDEEYAFDIDEVEEIIRFSSVTPVPDQPKLVRGVINLRGNVVPVASLHQRLGVDEAIDEDTKILVCKLGSNKLGFLVDSVSEVMHLDSTMISSSDNRDEIISHVIMLDSGKRLILKLAPDVMMDQQEIRDFTAKGLEEKEIHA